VQPTRDLIGTSSSTSLLGLAPGGGYPDAHITAAPVVSYTTISPLPGSQQVWSWRYVSVARSRRLLPSGCYPAPCSMECGLSSTLCRSSGQRQPGRPGVFRCYHKL